MKNKLLIDCLASSLATSIFAKELVLTGEQAVKNTNQFKEALNIPKKGTVNVNDTYIEKPKNPIEDVITQTMSGLKDAVKSVVSDQISSLPEEEMDNLFAGLQEGLERKKKEVLSQEESSDNTEKPVSNVTQPIDIRKRLKNNKR